MTLPEIEALEAEAERLYAARELAWKEGRFSEALALSDRWFMTQLKARRAREDLAKETHAH